MHDRVGTLARDHGERRFAISGVEVGVRARDHLERRERLDHLPADLPAGPRHEDFHAMAFMR